MTGLAALKVPGPTQIALTAPFWAAAADGRLTIQHCDQCGQHVFYPREICPHCWADALRWIDASGRATLKSWSRIHKPGHPGWIAAAPYVVGIVSLQEGPTMLSHILSDAPVVGDALVMRPTMIGGRVLPCFAPAGDTIHVSKGENAR